MYPRTVRHLLIVATLLPCLVVISAGETHGEDNSPSVLTCPSEIPESLRNFPTFIAESNVLLIALSRISKGQSEESQRSSRIQCPKDVPDRLPGKFPLLVEMVNRIHVHVSTGNVNAIRETFLKQGLIEHGGDVLEVRFGFSSLGGITNVTVEIGPYSRKEKRMLSLRTRLESGEVVGFSQLNLLWKGNCEATVEDTAVTKYCEGYIDFDKVCGNPITLGYIGLQVEWSPEGDILREEYLKQRRPFRLSTVHPSRTD